MKQIYSLILISLSILFSNTSFAGGCSPSSTNTTCATAVTLTSGSACTNGTTCTGGTGSSTGACIPATGYECS